VFSVLIMIFLSGVVSAELSVGYNDDSLPKVLGRVYQQDKEVDLKVPCFNNGTYCSGSATCNVTILYPNSSVLVDNQLMTNGGSYHNYTLTSGQTNTAGEYSGTVVCEDNGNNGKSTFSYSITASGNTTTGNEGNTYLGFILLILGLSGGLIFLSINFKEEHPFLHLLFLFVALMIFIFGLHSINEMMKNITATINTTPIYFIVLILSVLVFIYYLLGFIIEELRKVGSEFD